MRKGAVEAGVGGSGKAFSLPGPPAREPGKCSGFRYWETRWGKPPAGNALGPIARDALGPPEGGPSTSGRTFSQSSGSPVIETG